MNKADTISTTLHPDSALLALCDRLKAVHRGMRALKFGDDCGSPIDVAAEAKLARLFDAETEAAVLMTGQVPRTVAGVSPLARLIDTWEGERLADDRPQSHGEARERCVTALVRGLTSGPLAAGLPASADVGAVGKAAYELGVMAELLHTVAAAGISGARQVCGTSVAFLAEQVEAQRERIELALHA